MIEWVYDDVTKSEQDKQDVVDKCEAILVSDDTKEINAFIWEYHT
jgi:hypothetical protein